MSLRPKKFSSIGRTIDPTKLYKTNIRKIDTIIVHCSDSPHRGDDAHTIDKWHIERWGKHSGLAYHFVITDDGTIQKGRWSDNAGGHAKGYNLHSIGVCFTGGYEYNDILDVQRDSLIKLLDGLVDVYNLEVSNVIGHNEVSSKDCPNLDMDKLREALSG